jgi:hypothetical protein
MAKDLRVCCAPLGWVLPATVFCLLGCAGTSGQQLWLLCRLSEHTVAARYSRSYCTSWVEHGWPPGLPLRTRVCCTVPFFLLCMLVCSNKVWVCVCVLQSLAGAAVSQRCGGVSQHPTLHPHTTPRCTAYVMAASRCGACMCGVVVAAMKSCLYQFSASISGERVSKTAAIHTLCRRVTPLFRIGPTRQPAVGNFGATSPMGLAFDDSPSSPVGRHR